LLTHKPTKRRTRRRRGIVAVLGALCVAATLALSPAGPASAYTPVPCGQDATPASVCPFPADPDNGYPPGQPAYTYNDCLWGYILNPNNVLTNQTGVDANNAYFTANFAMPPHSNIILHGQFPHARFYSFTTYGTVNGTVGVATSWFFDYQINPDPGSQNPFQPGVRRDVRDRNFTLTISSEVKPDNPPPNTLYAGAAGQTDRVQHINVTMRFYLPDRLYLPVSPTSNVMGGVAPPTHTIVLADGKTYAGNAMCKVVHSVAGAPNGANFFSSGVPNALYAALRPLGPVGHPATRVPEWQRYYNETRILKPLFQHTRFAFLIPFFYNETPAVSFFPNPANTYIVAPIDRRLGRASGGHKRVRDPFQDSHHPQDVSCQSRVE
jgi:hypothetical protein